MALSGGGSDPVDQMRRSGACLLWIKRARPRLYRRSSAVGTPAPVEGTLAHNYGNSRRSLRPCVSGGTMAPIKTERLVQELEKLKLEMAIH